MVENHQMIFIINRKNHQAQWVFSVVPGNKASKTEAFLFFADEYL